jgi:L-alanine-DL-glutamate epimerase-like enolase superfamily enzyme
MKKPTDASPCGAELYFLPFKMRVPLKFGHESVESGVCARVKITVRNGRGNKSEGWGETPLSVPWVWPSALGYEERQEVLQNFCTELAKAWAACPFAGHPVEIGHEFQEKSLVKIYKAFNRKRGNKEKMPWLSALVCCSPFDIALHDAYGRLHNIPVYETYNKRFMNHDLAHYLAPASKGKVSFKGKYPADYLVMPGANELPAWHLVGGKDAVEESELTGQEPKDGYPVLLRDWIRTDGLKCLKIKLRGNDSAWDYDRVCKVGKMAVEEKVDWLTADFNCTVTDPAYVNEILDRLVLEHPRIHGMILYVEQPFPYDLEKNQIDVHSLSARKPLFMDESAHDWHLIKLGRELGWSGVALKTCKTQTGALLSLCWARAHGMTLMVQDLSNPMLAQIPHCVLASHAGTIMGVESNSMQFYPEISKPEARVHMGLYKRNKGRLDLSTIKGAGFGYRLDEIKRTLPKPVCSLPA